MKAKPSFNRVFELLQYNPLTGTFAWKVSRGRVSKGQIAGNFDKDGYVVICIDGRRYRAARLAWLYMTGEWPEDNLEIDHRNGLGDDNSWDNLRSATRKQNAANTGARRDNKTGLKGAYPDGRGRFRASIRHGGKSYRLGTFATAQEAHQAYCVAARGVFQEFSRF